MAEVGTGKPLRRVRQSSSMEHQVRILTPFIMKKLSLTRADSILYIRKLGPDGRKKLFKARAHAHGLDRSNEKG